MIKFHSDTDYNDNAPTFKEIKEDQFFIDENGFLSQKVSDNQYHAIATPEGRPFSLNLTGCHLDMPIKKILPHVTKITWE